MINGEKNTTKKGLFLTGAISLLAMLVVLFIDGFYPFGTGSVAALDLHSQYIPILYRFYDTVTGVKNIAVDFHIGGGLNMYSDTLTELLNPFNYVLFLFGRTVIYKSVNILLVLYIMAASMSAYFAFSKLFPKNNFVLNVILSLSYGMSYFNAYQYEIIRWLYLVVLFPLFVLALMRMLEKEKPLLFILMLGYILIISLQFGIQLCFFSFVFSTCYLVKESGGKLKDISGKRCLMTGLSFIAAVLISGIGTVPAVINLMGSARSVQSDSILSVISHHGLDNILERLLEISSPVCLGVFIASIMLLKKEMWAVLKVHREVALCFLILLVTVLLEPSNLMWHLGSYQCFPVRYGYIVLWLELMLVSWLYETCTAKLAVGEEKSSLFEKMVCTPAMTVICVLLGAALCGFVYIKRLMFAQAFATLDISKMCRKETVLVYIILLGVSLAVAFIYAGMCRGGKKLSDICLTVLTSLVGIIWFMAILWPQSSPARISNEEAYAQMTSSSVTKSVEQYSGHIKDDMKLPLNSALVTGEYSMSAYVPSGEGLEYVEAMGKLGYETPWVSVTTGGGNAVSDRFLGMDGEYTGALEVTKDEYDSIGSVADVVELQKDRQPVSIVFDNRKAQVKLSASQGADYLLLPLAFISGWSSSKGNVGSYLGGFLAIEMNGETGEVVLDYSVPGLKAGLLISAVGLILLAFTVFGGKWAGSLSRVAKYLYIPVAVAFAVIVYVLPNLGMLVFMGAKAAGYDLSPYLETSKKADENVHTLLAQSMEEDGLHVLIGCNNLLNDKGVKITASDEESADFRAARAVDGDMDSRWSSVNDWDSNDHFLQADFREIKTVKAVNICWERTNACAYTIEVSDDGENWSCVSEFNEPALSNPQIIYYEDGLSTRYLRLHVTDVLKNEEDASVYYQNISVKELEVYDDKCDSFVIAKPELTAGYDRTVPISEVPKGYRLKVGGINYDNLLNEDKFADTVGSVDISLGYELGFEGENWDLQGFELTLPASDGNDAVASAFPYKNFSVREWVPGEGTLSALNVTPTEKIDSDMETALGSEGYEIDVTKNGINLIAADEQGLCWGRVTLEKMLAENESSMPCGIIRDYPEYAVRGFVLDVARRPISIDFLYKIVDAMSDNYMNTLQLHFNDNAIITENEYDGSVEGARKLYSAFKLESEISSRNGNLTSEDCYSDEDIKELIEYAKSKGVEVVPEIDTPAHSMAITKLFPEYGFRDYPELADSLDVTNPEAVEFAKNLWSYYLNDKDIFDNCDTVHLGMDEYFGDNAAYSRYLSDMCSYVGEIAPEKKLRVWASLTYNDVDVSSLSKNIEMMVWRPICADPLQTYNDGFGVINCLNKNLYIIVDGGLDRIDVDNLINNWEPNIFRDDGVDETIPNWSPRMLGACYCMWNDNYCKNGTGPSEDSLYDRFEEPIEVLSDKLWNH